MDFDPEEKYVIFEGKRYIMLEPKISDVPPGHLYRWACDEGYILNEEEEAKMALDPYWACLYAKNILRRRFPLGEPTIASDCGASYRYAKEVIGGRFGLGEAAIAQDSCMSFCYAIDVLHGRFLLGEPMILMSVYALEYNKMLNLNNNLKEWGRYGF